MRLEFCSLERALQERAVTELARFMTRGDITHLLSKFPHQVAEKFKHFGFRFVLNQY